MSEHLDSETIIELNEIFGDEAIVACQHVGDCTHCQREIAELQLLATALRGTPAPSSEMTERAAASVAVLAASESQRQPSIVLDIFVFVTASVTALAAFGLLTGVAVPRLNVAILIIAVMTGIVASALARRGNPSAA